MSGTLQIWWWVLCAAAVINVAAWSVSAWLLPAHGRQWPREVYRRRRLMLWLAAIYVLGCGWRSVLPIVEVPRICLHDFWFSRVVVSRTIATVAELAFATQCALLLREAGTAAHSRFTVSASRLIIPLVVLAELFCWWAVLSASYLPHALENSHWTLAGVLGAAGLISVWPRVRAEDRHFLAAAIACAGAYVAFMASVDVPMYVSRWLADVTGGHTMRPLLDGLDIVMQRCVVTHDWVAWRQDALWMTLYFTVAVWISIAAAHAPLLRRALPSALPRKRTVHTGAPR